MDSQMSLTFLDLFTDTASFRKIVITSATGKIKKAS
jgi:hypothetical protein